MKGRLPGHIPLESEACPTQEVKLANRVSRAVRSLDQLIDDLAVTVKGSLSS